MNRNLLCLTCGFISEEEYNYSPALRRMSAWQDKIATFWGSHPYFFYFIRATPIWFALAVLSAFFDFSRDLTPIFLSLAILTLITREFYPLAPIPFNIYNVITSRADAYTTAGYILIASMIAIMFLGMFMALAEEMGNIRYYSMNSKNGLYTGDSPPVSWSVEPLPYLSIAILILPLLYFGSLALCLTQSVPTYSK